MPLRPRELKATPCQHVLVVAALAVLAPPAFIPVHAWHHSEDEHGPADRTHDADRCAICVGVLAAVADLPTPTALAALERSENVRPASTQTPLCPILISPRARGPPPSQAA
jgi:hypothetical protein